MAKPISRIALAFWIIAVIFLVVDAFILLTAEWARELYNHSPSYVWWPNTWVEVRASIMGAGLFAGLGTVIEFLDRIVWNLTPPELRHLRKPQKNFLWFVRNWPHSQDADPKL